MPRRVVASPFTDTSSWQPASPCLVASELTTERGTFTIWWRKEDEATCLVLLLHGAAQSSLVWNEMVREAAATRCSRDRRPLFVAVDARGHGRTADDPAKPHPLVRRPPHEPPDLTLPTLRADILAILDSLAGRFSSDAPIPLHLVGHSLGGAVATAVAESLTVAHRRERAARTDGRDGNGSGAGNGVGASDGGGDGDGVVPLPRCHLDAPPHCLAPPLVLSSVCLFECVEGTAVPLLRSLPDYLDAQPSQFASIDDAVSYATSSQGMGMMNRASAQLSIPEQLVERTATNGTTYFTWRTDLSRCLAQTDTWFANQSAALLSLPLNVCVSLSLSHLTSLDTELTIGHMQGRIRLHALGKGGVGGGAAIASHQLMEDMPRACAAVLVDSLKWGEQQARLKRDLSK